MNLFYDIVHLYIVYKLVSWANRNKIYMESNGLAFVPTTHICMYGETRSTIQVTDFFFTVANLYKVGAMKIVGQNVDSITFSSLRDLCHANDKTLSRYL